MPVASIWGPYLWKFLHTFAGKVQERHGKETKFKKDEELEAKWILSHIDKIIPCKECLAHLVAFKRHTPIPPHSSGYAEWVWIFHESVNRKLGKTPGPPLHEVGIEGNISQLLKEYIECIEDSILQTYVRRIHVIEFQRHVSMWINYLI
jgi:hypothetical protein